MTSKYGKTLEESGEKDNAAMAKEFESVTPDTWGNEIPASSVKMHKEYPHMYLKLKDIPEAKDWEVGKYYSIEVLVKQTSRQESDSRNEVGFDVVGVKPGKEIAEADIPEDMVEDVEEDDSDDGDTDE